MLEGPQTRIALVCWVGILLLRKLSRGVRSCPSPSSHSWEFPGKTWSSLFWILLLPPSHGCSCPGSNQKRAIKEKVKEVWIQKI